MKFGAGCRNSLLSVWAEKIIFGKLFVFLAALSAALIFTLLSTLFSPVFVFAATLPDNLNSGNFGSIDASEFDHSITGFTLDGNHSLLDCESCHVGGVFDELPRECSHCHDNVFAIGTSPSHIPVVEACDTCHSTLGFEASAMTTLMDHSVLAGQPCMGCHNGIDATGKSATHVQTILDCDACHNVNSWLVTAFDHNNVNGQPCVSCHNGVEATGKHASHIASSDTCDSCHLTSAWLPLTQVDHTQVFGPCVDCHDNVVSSGKPVTHISTTTLCDACHLPAPATWIPVAQVDHAQVLGVCSSCHDGVIATGKHAAHVVTTEECDACHSTSQWVPAAVDHSTFFGNCISCHDGVSASGKSASHIATSEVCDACHEKFPAGWTPVAATAVDHSQVIGTCVSCHNNVAATGKPPAHINTTDSCDACHAAGPTPFAPVALGVDHTEVLGVCSSCHDGVIATGKHATHIATIEECDSCHSTSQWVPAAVDHTGFVGNCVSCHNGVNASGKSINHIATTDVCDACHSVFPAQWTPVPNSSVDHNEVLGICSSCHDNIIATGKGPLHIVTNQECDICHATSAWIPASGGPGGATPDHSTFLPSDCAGCHNGVNASGKSVNHINTTDMCASCHQAFPATWTPVPNSSVDHNEVLGTCMSCHDNVIATGKGPLHIITSLDCDACHATSAWIPASGGSGGATPDHSTFLPADCAGCHNGVNASGKSATHLNTTEMCASCHLPFPATWAPVAATSVDHAEVIGICSSCHNGTLASGKSVNHLNTSNTCDACHQVGPSPWAPVAAANVDHGHVVGTCVSCHNGTTASGKSAAHINTTDVCDACHQTAPAGWTPVPNSSVDHVQVNGVCSSCHDNIIATGKGAGHIQTTLECDACHTTNAWTPASGGTPDHGAFLPADCASCHDGVTASGKSATHISSTTLCDSCHQRFPAAWTPVASNAVDHNEVIGTCASCHNGTTAVGKPANHPSTTDVCDVCHSTPVTMVV